MSLSGASKWRQHLTLDFPRTAGRPVWLHACSVGEVGSVAPLIETLLKERLSLHLTVVTKTGFAHARRLFGSRIGLSYLPWDAPGLMGRWTRRLDPRILLLAETEFWPGMLAACRKRGIPVLGINTRISDRSFPRYRASRFLWRRWLSSVSLFLAQSELDARRLAGMGVDSARIQVAGNLKYAVSPPRVDAASLRLSLDESMNRPILLAASTHNGEEALLLKMLPEWRRLCPELLLLLAPRHPQRFEGVAEMMTGRGVRWTRWSQQRPDPQAEVVLVDTMGALAGLYAIADIAIIGGSLAPVGGHNPLEAAICGRGVITGPCVQNFREIMRDMQHAGAAVVAENNEALNQAVQYFLRHSTDVKALNARAAAFMQDKARVLERTMDAIRPFLEAS